jgi:hypothetical protein
MRSKHIFLLLPLSLLAACAEQSAEAGSAPVSAEEVLAAADSVSFASDVADINSSSRKIIRTADMRCRVDDVFAASIRLEKIVKDLGGIVEESRLSQDNNYTRNIYYKPDSLKQVQTYTTRSFLTLRVPAASIDSVVAAIPEFAVFIEKRDLQQEDVTLQYLSNSLKNNTGAASGKSMAVAKKTEEVINADEHIAAVQEQKIDRSIENLQLLDNANYATIKVEFFQPERVNTVIVINPDHFSRPAYGAQMVQSLSRGWELVRNVFLAFITVWPLLLIAAVALLIVSRKKRVLRFSGQ